VYAFRNSIYNVQYSPFKLHNDTAGVLLFHNTSVSAGIPFHIEPAGDTVTDVITRNNLFVGARGPALRSTGRMVRCDFDADGYGWSHGGFALWNGRAYPSPGAAKASGLLYAGHGAITVDRRALFATGLRPPDDVRTRFPVPAHDLRLAPGSPAVDRGVSLPGFDDGFRGAAPDLGCCELGEPLPHYGPR
jgi:hypothetical protein